MDLLAALVFVGLAWGFVEVAVALLHRPSARGRVRRALARGEPRRARAIVRLARRRTESADERVELARLEAEACLWDGAFARVPPPASTQPAPDLLVAVLACLLDERPDDARPTLEVAGERLAADPELGAELLTARAILAYLDGELASARTLFLDVVARGTPFAPLRVTADFFLAAIAHRDGDLVKAEHHLACACVGGRDIVVGRWARETWRELYGTPPPARPRPRRRLARLAWLGSALASLRAGIASLVLFTRATSTVPGALRRVAPVGALAALVSLAFALLRLSPEPDETPPYLTVAILAFAPFLFVVPAALVSAREPRASLRLLGAFYAASPFLVAFTYALAKTGGRFAAWVQVFVAVWSALVFARLGWRVAHARGLRVALGLLLFTLGWVVPLRVATAPFPFLLVREGPPPRPRPTREVDLREIEARAFVESNLLRDQTDALAPERPGVPDLWFVAFGGWARQDVFVNEVRNARALLDERWGTRGRSIAFANDPQTRGELPLASPSSLRQTLDQLGRKMNRDEDVLFLFLTSHGSSDGLALSYPESSHYPDGTLAPNELRGLLDAAQIRWRVLVIAGCESGVFADALAGDTTLVATAAANDRASYGCAAGNAYTDFGKALFGEELRKTFDLPGALEAARASVTAREQADKLVLSEPRILAGPSIAPKLRELQTRLEARP